MRNLFIDNILGFSSISLVSSVRLQKKERKREKMASPMVVGRSVCVCELLLSLLLFFHMQGESVVNDSTYRTVDVLSTT